MSLNLAQRLRITRHHLRHPSELWRQLAGRSSPRRIKVSTSLRFLHEVLGLERFHYGLWDGEPLSIEGLRRAQQRYSDTLLAWVPDGVHSILDVGCGVGEDARELTARGYHVEGLSPDPYQQQKFVERTGLPFHLCRFQDHEPTRCYDLLLMSESVQYIWLDSLFPQILRLAPGGHLLIADYFLIGDAGRAARSSGGTESGHPLNEFLRRAEAAGLTLEREEDVTERVLPTLDLGARWIDSYVSPSIGIATDAVKGRHPYLYRLGRMLFGRRIDEALGNRRMLDSAEFRRDKRYVLLLFRIRG